MNIKIELCGSTRDLAECYESNIDAQMDAIQTCMDEETKDRLLGTLAVLIRIYMTIKYDNAP